MALVAIMLGLVCLVHFSVLNSVFRKQPLRDLLRSLDTKIHDTLPLTDFDEKLPKLGRNKESKMQETEKEIETPRTN